MASARSKGLPSLLITFEPHPLSVVAPERKPELLQTRRQKLDALEQTGLSDLLIVPFNAEMAGLDGESFFTEVLDPALTFAAIHVGNNFRFGRNRNGNLELLSESPLSGTGGASARWSLGMVVMEARR